MKPIESITNMFTRFTNIVNCLKSLDKDFTNSELIKKILRSLPKNWESKVTTIQEAKDLNKLPLDELLGSLMTYKLARNQSAEEEFRKKKSFALKVADSSEDDTEGSNSENEEDDFALITKGFRKILKGRERLRRKKFLNKTDPSKEKEKDKD